LFSIILTSENKNKKRKDLIAESKDIPSSLTSPATAPEIAWCLHTLLFL